MTIYEFVKRLRFGRIQYFGNGASLDKRAAYACWAIYNANRRIKNRFLVPQLDALDDDLLDQAMDEFDSVSKKTLLPACPSSH